MDVYTLYRADDHQAGFTLVEMMVAMLLTGLVATLLTFAMLSARRATLFWQHGLEHEQHYLYIRDHLHQLVVAAKTITIRNDSTLELAGYNEHHVIVCNGGILTDNAMPLHGDAYRILDWQVQLYRPGMVEKKWLKRSMNHDRNVTQIIEISGIMIDSAGRRAPLILTRCLPENDFGRLTNPFDQPSVEGIWPVW